MPLGAADGFGARVEVGSDAVSARAPTPVEIRTEAAAAAPPDLAPSQVDTASVYRRYAPYVAKIGMRILGRREEVEDFVQDVFVSVHRNLGALRDPGAIKSWIATLAVHEATRRLKRYRLKRWLGLDDAPDYTDIADAEASPEQRALLARVFRLLDGLPAEDRVAWALRYIEGETMPRVAELCDCSLSTAKRRVASAEVALERLGVGRV
jgi:RNA polymerase sigma-70 factor (ECF subfamily)